jgi:F420-0:gamma-glutamyl ligase
MKVIPIRTKVLNVGDDIFQFVVKNLGARKLQEGDVLAITSKIISLSEDCIINKSQVRSKEELVKKEADVYFGKGAHECHLTIKHGIMIPSAGIDESNAEGDFYILYPKDPYQSARKLWLKLKKHYKLKNLGIILTDSHTTPLRRGVSGISLAHCGFHGVESLVGTKDIFGREMKFTYLNHADVLAVIAVYQMGETNERKPMAILRKCNLKFTDKNTKTECLIDLKEDIYLPILTKRPSNGIN